MQFELTGDAKYPYKLEFVGDEIATVKSVFREKIFRKAQLGNTSSISEYEIQMAGWDIAAAKMSTTLSDPVLYARRFEEFHDHTDEAITDFAQDDLLPPFLNDNIVTRRKMGTHALQLAIQMRQEVAKSEGFSKETIDQIDIDTEISTLLEGSDGAGDSPAGP